METDILKIKRMLESGPKGQNFLAFLNKQSKFAQAISSEIGRQLLIDSVRRAEYLLDKIINEKSSLEERAEFRALHAIIDSWTERLNSYLDGMKKVEK